jgi:F420-0:gamma-glutamyl ligase
MKFEFIPIKTRVVRPPKDEIFDILDNLDVRDGDIVFITSKILAIHQGRTVPREGVDKQSLIEREAMAWLPHQMGNELNVNLTITENVLIAAAGIDESNADGHFILWPKEIDKLCFEIRERLLQRIAGGVRGGNHFLPEDSSLNLAVVATDSHTMPLRYGVTGISIGLAGVDPLVDLRGEPDIFGRKLHVTTVNRIDPLASMAVLLMGEAAEQTPIVILRGYKGIKFDEKGSMKNFKIPPEIDIYQPLLDVMKRKN